VSLRDRLRARLGASPEPDLLDEREVVADDEVRARLARAAVVDSKEGRRAPPRKVDAEAEQMRERQLARRPEAPRDPSERAARMATMGAPVDATIEPMSDGTPMALEGFARGLGGDRRGNPEDLVRAIGMGKSPEGTAFDADVELAGSGTDDGDPLMMDDPLGAGVDGGLAALIPGGDR
jgi:hypothetical protein